MHLDVFCEYICVAERNLLCGIVELILYFHQKDTWVGFTDDALCHIDLVAPAVRTDLNFISDVLVYGGSYPEYVCLTHIAPIPFYGEIIFSESLVRKYY